MSLDWLNVAVSSKDWMWARVRELGLLAVAPSAFMRLVASESRDENFKRVALYAVAFSLAELALFSAFYNGPQRAITAPLVFGVAVAEAAFALIWVPVFAITGWVARSAHPIRVSVVYALSFHFAFFLAPITAYALFLGTEDYTFAMVRGVLADIILLAYVVTFPAAVGATVRARILAICSGLGLAAAFMLCLSYLDSTVGGPGTVDSLSILYDPVGSEVDRSLPRIDSVANGTVAGANALERPASIFTGAVLHGTVPGSRPVLDSVLMQWPETSAHERTAIARERALLTRAQDSARFETTRALIRLRLNELDSDDDFLGTMDRYMVHPTTRGALSVVDAHIAFVRSGTAFLHAYVSLVSLRIHLARAGLILYDWK